MYIVESGDVNIHLPGEDSRRISLKDIARGEYFGELALFDDKPRSASALATTDAVLLELQRSTLEALPRAAPARGDGDPAHDERAPARDQHDAVGARGQERR